MMRRILLLLLLSCSVQCGLSCSTMAQTAPVQPSSCFLYLTANDLGIDMGVPVPFGAFLVYQNTLPGEGGESVYGFAKANCVPPSSSGCSRCRESVAAGHPIDVANGNTFIVQNDLAIPGLGGGLALTRTWNSQWPLIVSPFEVGIFGANWRSTYEEKVFLGVDNYPKYLRSDGSVWSFGVEGSSTATWSIAAPANEVASLNTCTSTNPCLEVMLKNGEQRWFDPNSGNLIKIVDRNGNATVIAYDSSGRLSTVTDAASRTLTFSYGSSGNLVTGLTSSVGISLSYSYDAQGRLTQVTKPDLSTLNFSYNSQSLIASVTDSSGKVLESHTYDGGSRGLTSTRANGVEAVTVSYPQ